VDKSLVLAEEIQGPTWYRLLETGRDYAAGPGARMPTRAWSQALNARCHLLNHFGADSTIPAPASEAIKIGCDLGGSGTRPAPAGARTWSAMPSRPASKLPPSPAEG
jgi:hypothetical protein